LSLIGLGNDPNSGRVSSSPQRITIKAWLQVGSKEGWVAYLFLVMRGARRRQVDENPLTKTKKSESEYA
jgi:hypothetical protein